MSSTRFPGKVLAQILGEPMVLRQIERIRRAAFIDELVVATSTHASDDLLVETLEAAGVAVVRGDLDDVLGRFIAVLDRAWAGDEQPDAVVRLTGDCPLASPRVIDQVIAHFRETGADYASNTMLPTFPDGLDVEVVRASVLREVADETTDPDEREHVTLGVYRRHDRYRVENLADATNHADLRWTVDTPEDFAFVSAVYDALYPGNPEFEYADVLALLAEHPELSRTEHDAARNAALIGLDTGAMQ